MEWIIYARKLAEPDYMESFVKSFNSRAEADKVKTILEGRYTDTVFRIAEINLNEKPDFIKNINVR